MVCNTLNPHGYEYLARHTGTERTTSCCWTQRRKSGYYSIRLGLVKLLVGLGVLLLVAMLCGAWRYQDLPMRECAWCHRSGVFVGLNRHHLTPQSVAPSRRDDPANLIVLCRACHACIGHRQNWRTYNPDVMEMVRTYTNTLPCVRGE